MMDPTRVTRLILHDPCVLGLPEILTVTPYTDLKVRIQGPL